MNKLSLISAGLFLSLGLSFAGLALTSQVQQSGLAPAQAEEGGPLLPAPAPGLAVLGKDVYLSQGCVHCHTQQVRPASQGNDIAKGWGKRPSVARDYVLQDRVLLGASRLGPDLADVGTRRTSDEWLHLHLFDPRIGDPASSKPAFRHLYELRPVAAAKSALSLPAGHAAAAPAGQAWVPTERATQLVAYLRSLRIDYSTPEAKLPE
jgi:cytochrome c oxidase cbb3-type subunit 2